MTQIIENFTEIADKYDALFVDLWGCMHNGLTSFPDAVKAMQDYRKTGGKVIFVTNAPRAWDLVAKQMNRFGIPDYSFFEPIKVVEHPLEITRVALDEAEGIVNCGPFDPHAEPEVMRPEFLFAREKGMKMLCANPDIVIDRGETREYCAGALAKLYTEMGGESLYFGKPHPPIYDLARRRLEQLDVNADEARILCIGDGIKTDILGAEGEGYDSLFITGGLAAEETATKVQPDADLLTAYLQKEKQSPTYAIGFLR